MHTVPRMANPSHSSGTLSARPCLPCKSRAGRCDCQSYACVLEVQAAAGESMPRVHFFDSRAMHTNRSLASLEYIRILPQRAKEVVYLSVQTTWGGFDSYVRGITCLRWLRREIRLVANDFGNVPPGVFTHAPEAVHPNTKTGGSPPDKP